MRIRSIRPEFWSSEDIASLTWEQRLIYIGLWSYVDDNGVGRDNAKLIAADLFPLEDDTAGVLKKIHGALTEYSNRQMITRYVVENKPYLHITAWLTHQKINRPSEGRYPLPTREDIEAHVALTEGSVSPLVKLPLGEGEKGRRGEGEKVAPIPTNRTKKQATSQPKGWKPNDSHKSFAAENGLMVEVQAAKFSSHHESRGNKFVSWDAAFRNWLIKSAEYARTDNRGPGRIEYDELGYAK